ncbi:MAG: glycosyltransferase family 4 protein [Dehalococcoidia bacterium]|nr:glycosyltransferase family 4 protein [Dehalococcoidia bacterium]
MRVFYCNNVFDHPVTGGEIFYSEVLNYLNTREGIELILPTETDLRFLNRPNNLLGINCYFFKGFQQLPKDTIIIEGEAFYYNFFLTNWLIKLYRPDLRIMTMICQVPDIFLSNSKAKWVHRIMIFAFLRSADVVGILSQSQKELMVQFGALEERTRVVYISGQRLKAMERSHRKKEGDIPLRIICVAHIRPRKGQKVLIEALHKLSGIPFDAVLVGGTKDQEYEIEVRMLIEKYGLGKQVRLVGMLEGEELIKSYVDADIFVLPSDHEPYGIVVQEAMSFGLPVVASNVDGIPEQVNDGVEGFLLPPGDVAALAGALRKLIVNPELRMQMGERGRQRATELPTWEEVFERFYQALKVVK